MKTSNPRVSITNASTSLSLAIPNVTVFGPHFAYLLTEMPSSVVSLNKKRT
ncbi:MAG: hypothetical protein ABIN18_07940 [Pseudomonadota bacterium]